MTRTDLYILRVLLGSLDEESSVLVRRLGLGVHLGTRRQVGSGQVRSGQVGSDRSKQVRSPQVRSGQIRSGQVRSG